MSNPVFFIDELQADPNSQFQVMLPASRGFAAATIKGFLTSSFSLGGASEYTAPDMLSLQGGLQQAFAAARDISAILTEIFGWDLAMRQKLLQSVSQTVQNYSGSVRPVFQVPMVFISVRPDASNSPLKNVLRLQRGVYPESVDFGGIAAPLGYTTFPFTTENDKRQTTFGGVRALGTVELKVGQWFDCPDLLIRDVNFQMSAEVSSLSEPLYAEGHVTFELFKVVDYPTLLKYFPLNDDQQG